MDVRDVVSRFDRLKAGRGNWEALWRDSANYILTRKNNISSSMSSGTRRDDQVFDTTACRSNEKLAAGLFSYLCPPNEIWFTLRSSRPELQQYDEVRRWYDDVSRYIREALYMSNFILEMHESFLDVSCFGTGNLYEDEGTRVPLNFKSIHIDEYFIAENHEGYVDTVFRKFSLTLRQVVEKFGEESLCEELRKLNDDPKGTHLDRDVCILHAVMPRKDRKPDKRDRLNLPFASMYIDYEHKKLLSEGGYVEQPYNVFRFTKASDEVWGRGPGITMLPEVKLLNKMKKTCLVGGEKAVDPPVLLPDDGVVAPFRTTPGAVNYWRANAFNNKPEAWKFEGNLPIGLEMMNMEKTEIERGFYTDLFEQLAQRKQEMTATEIVERVKEKLVLIAPAIGRLQNELLSPVIHRSFRILGDMGVLPPMPGILGQYPQYEVYYVSKLAMAIKLLDVDATTETFTTVLPLIQYDPSIMDSFNFDAIVRGTAHRNGMPSEFVRSMEEVEGMREARKKEEEAAKTMEMLKQASDAASGLGKKVEPGSPLASMGQMVNQGAAQ
jgi:hypothetical protein